MRLSVREAWELQAKEADEEMSNNAPASSSIPRTGRRIITRDIINVGLSG